MGKTDISSAEPDSDNSPTTLFNIYSMYCVKNMEFRMYRLQYFKFSTYASSSINILRAKSLHTPEFEVIRQGANY